MATQKRSAFDWLTVGAAWGGVLISSFVAYHQYRQSTLGPDLEFGQFGACYKVEGQADERIYWRLMLANAGNVAAKDIFIKIVDVPEDAKIWSSVAYTVEERTKDTLLIKLKIMPPRYASYVAILPFARRGQESMPYAREQYYNCGSIKQNPTWDRTVEIEVLQEVVRTKGYISGVKGNHRNWDDPITADDVDIGTHTFTIEDR